MKKALSLLLSSAMILSVLSGCTSKTDTSGGSTSSKTPNASTASTDKPKSDKIDLTEKPTLRILMPYVPFDPNTDYSATFLEQATGYKVKYEVLPNEDAATKLNTTIASKEPFDIFVLNKVDFDNSVATGAYLPLDDLLPVYGTDIQAKTASGLWSNVTVDGKTMGIPEGFPSQNYGISYRVRTDLMKKAGVENMPTTPDELYTALKAIKTKLNIIPFSSTGAVINEIASAFSIPNIFNIENGEMVHRGMSENGKEYVTYMNKLFSEGLLDNEWAQNTGDKMKEKFFTSKTAIYRMAWWDEPGASTTLAEKAPGATYDYLPALKNSDGKAMLPYDRGTNKVMVIPRVSKNAEHAINYMNVKLEENIFKELSIGKQDTHYKVIDEKTLEPILPIFFDELSNSQYYLTGTDTEAYNFYWYQTRVKKNEVLYSEFSKIQENASKAELCYNPVTFMAPNKAYTDIISKVNKFTEDSFVQFITGSRPIAEWDAYVTEWKNNGGEELNKVVSAWWSENKASVEPQLIQK